MLSVIVERWYYIIIIDDHILILKVVDCVDQAHLALFNDLQKHVKKALDAWNVKEGEIKGMILTGDFNERFAPADGHTPNLKNLIAQPLDPRLEKVRNLDEAVHDTRFYCRDDSLLNNYSRGS